MGTASSGALAATSMGIIWRSSKSQSGDGGVSHEEEVTGSGWSGGEEETEEKKSEVASESKGHRSPPPADEGSMSILKLNYPHARAGCEPP